MIRRATVLACLLCACSSGDGDRELFAASEAGGAPVLTDSGATTGGAANGGAGATSGGTTGSNGGSVATGGAVPPEVGGTVTTGGSRATGGAPSGGAQGCEESCNMVASSVTCPDCSVSLCWMSGPAAAMCSGSRYVTSDGLSFSCFLGKCDSASVFAYQHCCPGSGGAPGSGGSPGTGGVSSVCIACPPTPMNGVSTCVDGHCGFECLSGFRKTTTGCGSP